MPTRIRIMTLPLLLYCLLHWATLPAAARTSKPEQPACAAPLLLKKSVDPPLAAPGGSVTYTLRLINQTTVTLTNVTLTDTLPAGLLNLAASDGGIESVGVIHWPATTLPPGAILTRTLHAQVDPALAQPPVLFFDDLEGDNRWTATGLWQPMTDDGPCANSYSPATSWYYGQSSDCTYDTGGPNTGELTMLAPITLPAGESKLTFWSWQSTEPFEEYDRPVVRISTDGESFTDLWYWADNTATWQAISVDLTTYAGQAVWLQFALDTRDEQHNHYPGWYIDDVQVTLAAPFLVNTATVTAAEGAHATATATLLVVPPPPHDAFDQRRVIQGPYFHDLVETTTATVAPTDPVVPCADNGNARTLWYELTPSTRSYLYAETVGTNYDTVVSLWTGERQALVNVACAYSPQPVDQRLDENPAPTGLTMIALEAGATYYLAVAEALPATPLGQTVERRHLQLRVNLIPFPHLVVEPAAIATTITGGGAITRTLWISNSGGADLTFELQWQPPGATDATWLHLDPLTGTVAGTSGMPVLLTMTTARLAQAGVYTGTMLVRSNDEEVSEKTVPVTLTVVGPQLTLGDATVFADQTFTVPLTLATNDAAVAATTFAITYDPTCLHIDPTDGNGDGLPDALRFALPAGVQTMAQHDATVGKLTLFLADTTPPLTTLPTGLIATLTLTARCRPAYGTTVATALPFAATPPATFGDPGARSLLGRTQAGAILIQPAVAGDCNADGAIDAADPLGVVLEIFDEDGTDWLATPGGAFPGNPPGCDANRDALIDAADLICTVLVIFNGTAPCASPTGATAAAGASLSLPPTLSVAAGQALTVPIHLHSDGQPVAAAIFALDFDPTSLHFDPTDRNNDGLPDAVTFRLPAGVTPKVTLAANGRQLQFVLADLTPPLTTLPNGELAVIHLTAQATQPTTTTVVFAAPPASLGTALGQSLPVAISNALVLIAPDKADSPQRRLYLPVMLKHE